MSVHALLPTRELGTTGIRITAVGFGAWAIGGGDWSFGWGAQEDANSIAAIRHALDRGINWIDTDANAKRRYAASGSSGSISTSFIGPIRTPPWRIPGAR